mmetsp:Transcript_8549/g.24439  ORF Transcript_8549/g.24439 Transcript_8549/m.24439 type:complete len:209 (-) Transcript_8549:224-850(-)
MEGHPRGEPDRGQGDEGLQAAFGLQDGQRGDHDAVSAGGRHGRRPAGHERGGRDLRGGAVPGRPRGGGSGGSYGFAGGVRGHGGPGLRGPLQRSRAGRGPPLRILQPGLVPRALGVRCDGLHQLEALSGERRPGALVREDAERQDGVPERARLGGPGAGGVPRRPDPDGHGREDEDREEAPRPGGCGGPRLGRRDLRLPAERRDGQAG